MIIVKLKYVFVISVLSLLVLHSAYLSVKFYIDYPKLHPAYQEAYKVWYISLPIIGFLGGIIGIIRFYLLSKKDRS